MHRRYTDSPTIRKVLQTLWYQVNNGQEIYVIGAILEDGTVRGGTGWGAEFAKLCNKPLCVFDQDKGHWLQWSGSEWKRADSPTVLDIVVTRDPAKMLPGVDNRTLTVTKGDRPV